MRNEDLYEKALSAIQELFGDTTISKREAAENLNTLISEIQIMLEALGDEEE